MITLPHFTLLRPATLAEAARLAGAPDARVVAGGTGLIPNLRLGLGAPLTLVSLDALEELRRIEVSPHGTRIGACVSLQILSEEPGIPAALREAARSVAAPAHRSAAISASTRAVFTTTRASSGAARTATASSSAAIPATWRPRERSAALRTAAISRPPCSLSRPK